MNFIDLIIRWKLVWGGIIFLALGGIILQHISNQYDEYYVPGFVSTSIAVSRSQKIFISQPILKSNVIRWGKAEYHIHEAWIEQTIKIKHDWMFFRRIIPNGYRLVLAIKNTAEPSDGDLLFFNDEVVCNNTITMHITRPSRPIMLKYGSFSSPIPDSINCVVKSRINESSNK
jgi:hypothetical protein